MIAVDKSLNAQMIGTGADMGAEQVYVKINCNGKNLILVQIYIRPDSPLEVYKANMNTLRDVVSKVNANDVLLVSGDFNLSNLNWFTQDDLRSHDQNNTLNSNRGG